MFVSAFYVPIVAFTFPPMVDFCVRYASDDFGRFRWRAVVDVGMMLFGLVMLVVFISTQVMSELYNAFHTRMEYDY